MKNWLLMVNPDNHPDGIQITSFSLNEWLILSLGIFIGLILALFIGYIVWCYKSK